MPLASSICVLFILIISANRVQFLNITFLLSLFPAVAADEVSVVIIISFNGAYALL